MTFRSRTSIGALVAALAVLIGSCGYPSEVAPFCEEAVAVFDGRTPIRPELENLRRLAIEYLPAETAEPLLVELDSLWDALQGGSEGHSTGAVAEFVTDICGASVHAVSSANHPETGEPLTGLGR